MNMLEVTIDVIHQRARETSAGEGIDNHWEPVLPEAIHCAANEIFLVLHRVHVNPLMEQKASLFAQNLPPRDIGNLDDGTLALHYYNRVWLLGMSRECLFQTLVDQSYGVNSNTTDANRWVRPSLIWVPHLHVIGPQICRSLVERYKHYFFAERCYAELLRRARKNPYMKHTFIQLTDAPDLYRLRNKGSEWLREASRRIATSVGAPAEVGEEVKQDWLAKLVPLPLHMQIQKARATRIEIEHRAYDNHHRKGGQYEHISFDDDLANTMPDESEDRSNEELIAEEYSQRLLECQTQIEAILSRGGPEQGKRRFKVILLIARKPHLTSSEIAKRLKKSEPTLKISQPTICRDRKIINENKDRKQY